MSVTLNHMSVNIVKVEFKGISCSWVQRCPDLLSNQWVCSIRFLLVRSDFPLRILDSVAISELRACARMFCMLGSWRYVWYEVGNQVWSGDKWRTSHKQRRRHSILAMTVAQSRDVVIRQGWWIWIRDEIPSVMMVYTDCGTWILGIVPCAEIMFLAVARQGEHI